MKHYLIHRQEGNYSSFPSVAIDKNDILYCVFRYAPTKKSRTHIDTRSLTLIKKSKDRGRTWQTISHIKIADYTGNQDAALFIRDDGVFMITGFGWTSKTNKHTKKRKGVVMQGVFIFESTDRGKTWTGKNPALDISLPIAVRSPIVQDDGDDLLLAGYANTGGGGDCSILLQSYLTRWNVIGRIAHDTTGALDFQEPALLDCGNDHYLCLMRVPREAGSRIYQAHSWDAGNSWEPYRDTGIVGLPPSLLRLKDGRILCTYGHRLKPRQIRACLSYDEGLSWDIKNEIIIRKGGGGWDIGYPSTVQFNDGILFTAYYFYTKKDKTRRIEGTIWKL